MDGVLAHSAKLGSLFCNGRDIRLGGFRTLGGWSPAWPLPPSGGPLWPTCTTPAGSCVPQSYPHVPRDCLLSTYMIRATRLGLQQHNCHTGVSCPLACALHPRQEGGENPKFFYLHFSRLGCAAPSWKTSWGRGKSLPAIPSRKAKQRNANVCKLMLVPSNLPCLPGREV